MLSTLRSPPEARRVALGNFLFKLIGCVLLMPLVGHVEDWIAGLQLDPAREVVALPSSASTSRSHCCSSSSPSRSRASPSGCCRRGPRATIRRSRVTSTLRRSTRPRSRSRCAAREALRIGDIDRADAERHADRAETNDRVLAERLRKMDDIVDELYTAVKLYLTQISREALERDEGRRWADIVSFTINMEQVGDIIERIIIDLEDKKIDKGRNFSEAGMAEICDLHARLIANLRLGMPCSCNGDLQERAGAARPESAVPRPRARLRRLAPRAADRATRCRASRPRRCTST